MDILINEIQEIIKNLESGGELSIKEEKYLKVAKLCGKLVAERDAATLEYDYLNDQIEYWKNKSINITEQRNELDADLPPMEHENVHYADAAEMEIEALRQRIAELEEAEQKLYAANITLDARAELAERQLAEMESRTVTVKLPEPPGPMSVGARTVYFGIVADVVGAFQDGLNAAGIKVEAE